MNEEPTGAATVAGLDDPGLSLEDRDLRPALALQQQENDAYDAEADAPRRDAPFLPPADRARIKEILQGLFKVDLLFIVHFARVHSKMKEKLRQARANIAARAGEDGSGAPPSNVHSKVPRITLEGPQERRPSSRMQRRGSSVFRLEERLTHWGLEQVFMEEDGNCQFRAMAHQLFGDAKEHTKIRRSCVEYLLDHSEEFYVFFDGDGAWHRYLVTMAMDGTFGDELTLKAASNIFGCNVHVVSSEEANYYLCYAPDDQVGGKGEVEDIFLAYVSPILFNSIQMKSE